MIKIEGSGEELASLFERCVDALMQRRLSARRQSESRPVIFERGENLSGVSAPVSGPTPGPVSGSSKAESFWGAPVPTSAPDKKKLYQGQVMKERAESGGVAWYHLVSEWSKNFNTEGDQPDRATVVTDAMNSHGRDILFYARQQGGLTRTVRSVSPKLSKAESRLIAENIASVSSALGIGLSDFLEYDQETRSIKS
tara:strand:- start:4117 stop:4707 length:591 start_codon:yes stop_codon:yes gene_type:complete